MVKKKKILFKLLFYGAVTVSLYAGLFLNEQAIKSLCIRGGVYALFPIVTALIFCFAHGNFTNYFWQSLGVEAKKKRMDITVQDRTVDRRKEIRTRLRA